MSNFFEFEGYKPVVHQTGFVHPNATVVGDVTIGRDVYIGAGAVIRGDWGEVIIEDGANIQENCVVHMMPGGKVHLMESAHIGHGGIIHGAVIGRNSLVGMNSVVMDNAVAGAECIIGALCFVPEGMEIPLRKIVRGIPAEIVGDVSEEMIRWKTGGTGMYQALPSRLYRSMKGCEPLRNAPAQKPKRRTKYNTWGQTKSKK